MAKARVEPSTPFHGVTAISQAACPVIGGVALDLHGCRARRGPRIKASDRAAQGKSTRINGLPGLRMTVAQQARDELQHDLWLRVATHRAEH